jgi:hypothetical protein
MSPTKRHSSPAAAMGSTGAMSKVAHCRAAVVDLVWRPEVARFCVTPILRRTAMPIRRGGGKRSVR